MTATASILDDTLAPLRVSHDWRTLVAGTPTGPGWVRVADIVANETLLRQWFDEFLAADAKGQKDVAGAYLASYVAGIIAEPVVEALVGARRAWPVTPDNLAVHRHELGWFDGLAVYGPDVRVVAGDGATADPDARVSADVDELRALVATELAALLDPMFATIREMAPFGLRGMWGAVADGLASGVLWSARAEGRDALDAWRDVGLVTDDVAGHARALRTRPDIEAISWRDGVSHVTVKGTCCLYYKVFDGVPDPSGEGYCLSCPKREPGDRHARWARYLEEEAAAG